MIGAVLACTRLKDIRKVPNSCLICVGLVQEYSISCTMKFNAEKLLRFRLWLGTP